MEPRDGLNSPGSVGGGGGLFTLRDYPRPARNLNEYVESPPTDKVRVHKVVPSRSKPGTTESLPSSLGQSQTNQGNPGIFTSQPKPSPKLPTGPITQEIISHEEEDSIICKHCQKCRCEKCRERRELPSAWLCNKKYLLSADNVVDKCTCLCAVKGCFYHIGKDYQQDNEIMCTDNPCACCSQPHCCMRWVCMSAMSVCLPCLCCYWPAKCAVKACTVCYDRCTNRGCQCASRSDCRAGSQNKRLLPESESSSA